MVLFPLQLTDKAGLLMREYCKCSVYDRMSTRPFLTNLEKKWITFQVLYALHRMHKLGICHGDIKVRSYCFLCSFRNTENSLVLRRIRLLDAATSGWTLPPGAASSVARNRLYFPPYLTGVRRFF